MQGACVALVSDFFYPSLGGIQIHIHRLAVYLSQRVKKVIVITHYTDKYMGVHIIDNVKVYYLALPHAPSLKAIFPTYLLEYPEAWRILTHEGIDIVHCHQTSSTLATSYAIFAKTLNLKVVHTEHSLFGYKSIAYIHFNFFLHVLFPHYDRLITVSRATRNNLLLRAGVKPSRAVVIPNTVKAKSCTRNKCKTDSIRVVVVGRLVYRRGIDLLMSMLVPLCNRNPKMDMTVIGDGPKMQPLRTLVHQHGLQSQVHLLGAKSNHDTLQILQQCDIFLNTAITESFGIALVEAAQLGLPCVSTNVGGISETLPGHILHTVDPEPNKLIEALEEVMHTFASKQPQTEHFVGYLEQDCSKRVTEVYTAVLTEQSTTRWQFLLSFLRAWSIPFLLLTLVILLQLLMCGILSLCQRLRRHKEKDIVSSNDINPLSTSSH